MYFISMTNAAKTAKQYEVCPTEWWPMKPGTDELAEYLHHSTYWYIRLLWFLRIMGVRDKSMRSSLSSILRPPAHWPDLKYSLSFSSARDNAGEVRSAGATPMMRGTGLGLMHEELITMDWLSSSYCHVTTRLFNPRSAGRKNGPSGIAWRKSRC